MWHRVSEIRCATTNGSQSGRSGTKQYHIGMNRSKKYSVCHIQCCVNFCSDCVCFWCVLSTSYVVIDRIVAVQPRIARPDFSLTICTLQCTFDTSSQTTCMHRNTVSSPTKLLFVALDFETRYFCLFGNCKWWSCAVRQKYYLNRSTASI